MPFRYEPCIECKSKAITVPWHLSNYIKSAGFPKIKHPPIVMDALARQALEWEIRRRRYCWSLLHVSSKAEDGHHEGKITVYRQALQHLCVILVNHRHLALFRSISSFTEVSDSTGTVWSSAKPV